MKIAINDRSKIVLKFLGILFVIGIITGIILYLKEDNDTKIIINNELNNLIANIKNTNQNNFIMHIITFSILFLLSFTVLGLPIVLFYFYYEGTSIGFLIISLIKYSGTNGLLFSLIFLLITKLIYILVLLYFTFYSIMYTKKIIHNIKSDKTVIIHNHLIKIIIIIGVILLNDIFLYFFGNKIVGLFLFLV